MADLRNYQARVANAGTRADAAIDEGLRAYMLKVYNLMALGPRHHRRRRAGHDHAGHHDRSGGRGGDTAQRQDADRRSALPIFSSPLRWVVILAPLAVVFFLSFRDQHDERRGRADDLLGLCRAWSGLSLSSIFLVYTRPEHRADLLRHGRRLRRAVALWLHDQARPDRDGLVPDHGRVRPHHRDGGQHLPAVVGAAVRHLGDRRADLRRPHRLRHAEDQGDVLRRRRRLVAGRKAIMGALRSISTSSTCSSSCCSSWATATKTGRSKPDQRDAKGGLKRPPFSLVRRRLL